MSARAEIVSIYIGYYNRAPDAEGLNYWIGRLVAGMTLAEIAASFSVQVESKNNYTYLNDPINNSPSSFLDTIYLNLFNRSPDAEGRNYWEGELEKAAGSPDKIGTMILNIISGAVTDPDAAILKNKGLAADYWETKMSEITNLVYDDSVAINAKAVLDGVTDNPDTVARAAAKADAFFAAETIDLSSSTEELTISTGPAADTIISGSGNDTINSGPGDDVIKSGAGNDMISIGDGDDVVNAGSGNDTVIAGNSGGNDFIDGGDGIDTISYPSLTAGQFSMIFISEIDRSPNPAVSSILSSDVVNLPENTQVGVAQISFVDKSSSNTDALINFENVIGGASDDFIIGNYKDNILDGGAGNDRLVGVWGNDTLYGRGGDDILEGGSGNNTLVGGAGADKFVIDTKTGIGLESGKNEILDFAVGEDFLILNDGISIISLAELNIGGEPGLDTIVTLSTGDVIHLLGVTGIGDGSSLFMV